MAKASIGDRVGSALASLKNAPPLLELRRRRHARWFASTRERSYSGVFESFGAAVAGAPPGRLIGSDHEHAAELEVIGGPETMRAGQRPRLSPPLLAAGGDSGRGHEVFDFGGHVGVKYYTFRPYLRYSSEFRWTVYDMPAVPPPGAGSPPNATTPPSCRSPIASRMPTGPPSSSRRDPFNTRKRYPGGSCPLEAAARDPGPRGAPVVRGPRVCHAPQHRASYCPYHVFNRAQMLEGILGLGYSLLDTWPIPDKKCVIPFEDARSVRSYTGFCFRRRG